MQCSSAFAGVGPGLPQPVGERLVVSGAIGEVLRYTQTLTLWRGIDRLDCRTTIDDFTGADLLVRLRWPCPVPGALPVSEVGDAVVGRGFGLMHDHASGEDRAVDSARHPWTLDNPAHGWFGLSSCRAHRYRGAHPGGVGRRSHRSIRGGRRPSRELMVALVRAGVTATCSSAGHPRYGHLDVDSNLPDARITLGGPEANDFTAAVLAAADPAYTAEVKRQLARGRARVFVPAAKSLDSVWVPDADLRGVLDLPVLIVAGDGAVDAVVADLDDAEITVIQECPAGTAVFEARTVALVNRGVPGFAVERDGTLHASLMRSCTGWPSGTWIDPPQRNAPDGSNFQLQHWSHTFDFALVTGVGDWRGIEMASRSAEFNHPLVPLAITQGSAGLAAEGSLLTVEPEHAVQLGALKPRGNPTATGSADAVDPAEVTVRLVETAGSARQVRLWSSVGSLSDPVALDLLEATRPAGGDALHLHGYQIATAAVHLDAEPIIDATGQQLAPDAESAQPLYARYWLHNRGPAPLGGLPAVAHLHPETVAARPGDTIRLRLTVASDCSDAAVARRGADALSRRLGTRAEATRPDADRSRAGAPALHVELRGPPRESRSGCPTTRRPATTRCAPSWRCPAICRRPGASRSRTSASSPWATRPTTWFAWSPNRRTSPWNAVQRARLVAAVASGARSDLNLEAHVISPWGTWEWIGPGRIRHRAARAVDGRGGLRRHAAAVADSRAVVGADPHRLRRTVALHPRRLGERESRVA